MTLYSLVHRRWVSFVVILGVLVVLGVVSTRTCAACMLQSPVPRCSATFSSLTLHTQDTYDAWWRRFLPRDPYALSVYLHLDYLGSEPTATAYRVDVVQTAGGAEREVASMLINAQFDPASQDARHTSHRIDIPYQDLPDGEMELTATRTVNSSACDFPDIVETTVPIVAIGPTVWPVTPRVCAQAGEQPVVIFGVHNPGSAEATLSLVARATDPFGSQTFALAGQDDDADLPPIRLRPNQARYVQVDCTTFGYCLAGAQNDVELEVRSTEENGALLSQAIASANVVIRAPGESCVAPRDWWFLLPTSIQPAIIGLSVLVAGLVWYRARRRHGSVQS